MASAQVSKTVYYFRARRNNKPFNLQRMIEAARKKKSTVGRSEIEFAAGDVVRIQHYQANRSHVLLHLARYVPGVSASTLQPKARAAEDDEGSQLPPRGREFKDGDCFLLVEEFHVLFCAHGIRRQKAALYLTFLFRECGFQKASDGFDLTDASNLDKLRLLRNNGVRAIHLSTNAFFMSLPEPKRRGWYKSPLGAMADELWALARKEETVAEQKALEDLLVNVELRLDGNTRASQDAQKFIEGLAETVLDDEESAISGFVIETQSGEKVTATDIRLHTSIKVNRSDNSVDHVSTWSGLQTYMVHLSSQNVTEQ